MIDAELAEFLGISSCKKETVAKIIAGISSEKRMTYNRMLEIENELILWKAGAGPKPTGVILCGERS